MLDTIRNAWGWIGLDPVEVVNTNFFGNVIVRAKNGTYWRICPEESSCTEVAASADAFANLMREDDFRTDWEMASLVASARQALGPLGPGRCYCLKIPAVVGGSYDVSNLGTISLVELISFSGDMALQIKDLPNGTRISFKIVP